MTTDQLTDAAQQLRSFCRLRIEAGDYDAVSARGALYTLGYDEEQADAVLAALYASGFTYCLDPSLPGPSGERPPSFACHWSPDQLESRVSCAMPR